MVQIDLTEQAHQSTVEVNEGVILLLAVDDKSVATVMWQPIQDGSTNIFKARNWQGRQLAQDDDTAQCPSEETAMTMIPIHPKYPLYLLPVEASVSRHLQMFACTTNGTVQTTLVVALSLVYAWQPVGPPLLGATIFALDDHRRLITINNATNTLMLHATSNGQIAWQSQEVVPPYDNQTTTTTHAWLLENEDDTIFVMDKNNDSNAIYVRIYNQTAETWLVESELKLVLPSVDAAGLSTSTDNPQTVLVTVASVSTTESTVALSSLLYDQMTAQWQEYGTFALPSHDAVSWLLAGNGRTHVTTDRNGMLRVLRKNENNTEWTTIYKFNPSILLQLQDDEEGFDVESKALSWDGSILAVTYTGKGSHGVIWDIRSLFANLTWTKMTVGVGLVLLFEARATRHCLPFRKTDR